MTGKELDLLLDTCLLAGKIMMESNAEMYRVEDTMSRIALASEISVWSAMSLRLVSLLVLIVPRPFEWNKSPTVRSI